VTGDLPDQVQVRVQVVRQGLFDGRKIASHRLQDPLFEIAHAISPIRSYSMASLMRARTNRPIMSSCPDSAVFT